MSQMRMGWRGHCLVFVASLIGYIQLWSRISLDLCVQFCVVLCCVEDFCLFGNLQVFLFGSEAESL